MNFEQIEIKDIFFEYDGPLIFSAELEGVLYLGYAWTCDEPNEKYSNIYFKTTPEDIERLTSNSIPIRKFFQENCEKNPAYKVWFKYFSGEQISCEEVNFSQIEDESPKPEIYLEAE